MFLLYWYDTRGCRHRLSHAARKTNLHTGSRVQHSFFFLGMLLAPAHPVQQNARLETFFALSLFHFRMPRCSTSVIINSLATILSDTRFRSSNLRHSFHIDVKLFLRLLRVVVNSRKTTNLRSLVAPGCTQSAKSHGSYLQSSSPYSSLCTLAPSISNRSCIGIFWSTRLSLCSPAF